MEKNIALWSNNKTRLIIIKSKGNSGKTTTIWMTLFELVNQGAVVKQLCYLDKTSFVLPSSLPSENQRYDFIAELEWFNLRIVLFSYGDTAPVVKNELDAILQTEPDYVICTSRSQWRANSTWELFEGRYKNIYYRRVCFWSEFSDNPNDQIKVKEPTVEAIVKYIRP